MATGNVTRGPCWQGRPHLPGIRRPSGELVCARCGFIIEPASAAKAWGQTGGHHGDQCVRAWPEVGV